MFQRRMMDKILDRCEEETPITNPKEPIRTFFRKLAYRLAVLRNRLGRQSDRRPPSDETEGGRK